MRRTAPVCQVRAATTVRPDGSVAVTVCECRPVRAEVGTLHVPEQGAAAASSSAQVNRTPSARRPTPRVTALVVPDAVTRVSVGPGATHCAVETAVCASSRCGVPSRAVPSTGTEASSVWLPRTSRARPSGDHPRAVVATRRAPAGPGSRRSGPWGAGGASSGRGSTRSASSPAGRGPPSRPPPSGRTARPRGCPSPRCPRASSRRCRRGRGRRRGPGCRGATRDGRRGRADVVRAAASPAGRRRPVPVGVPREASAVGRPGQALGVGDVR